MLQLLVKRVLHLLPKVVGNELAPGVSPVVDETLERGLNRLLHGVLLDYLKQVPPVPRHGAFEQGHICDSVRRDFAQTAGLKNL